MAIRRELAAANPDRYRPDLAASLSNLGVWFSAAGPPGRGAAGDRGGGRDPPGAGRRQPDRYRPDLASSLSNLGVRSRSWAARPRRCRSPRRRSRSTGSWPPPTPTATAPTWPARCPTSASGSRSWAARPRRCRSPRRRSRSTGSWPPPTPTATAPTWPARCPTSASAFSELGRPAEALPVDRGGGGDPPGAGRRLPRPVPPRPGPLAVQPRHLVLGAGPPGRRAAGRPRRRSRSAGSWPPPTPTATAPTWPTRCPTSASGSPSWAARPRRCR